MTKYCDACGFEMDFVTKIVYKVLESVELCYECKGCGNTQYFDEE
ncbi:hypothetical protein PQC39_gp019 [Vibrio phage Vp_R1]|uniref:Uncharacterized protein n=1 Tax=Vibrio phage Vp_R1 TaxID=2059867 RepID=A0A2H5BPX5_9CAUD|nr:hypothetical protein PQC39_gp019 [Vibrio phage Vp_R1]AUG88383.1 hypothetical protein VPR_019 [Vibrio phage Vp_R1]